MQKCGRRRCITKIPILVLSIETQVVSGKPESENFRIFFTILYLPLFKVRVYWYCVQLSQFTNFIIQSTEYNSIYRIERVNRQNNWRNRICPMSQGYKTKAQFALRLNWSVLIHTRLFPFRFSTRIRFFIQYFDREILDLFWSKTLCTYAIKSWIT